MILAIVSLSFLITAVLFYLTLNMCYFAGSRLTDNEKMVLSANEISIKDWPSKMHDISFNRSQMREYWTIFLRILIKIGFYNKKSDHLNITLGLICNFISSILIFYVFSNYFDSQLIGFLISLIYLSSFWPYFVALHIGHIHLAQVFCLISILLIQYSEITSHFYLVLIFAGIFSAAAFFSSSASRKYPPLSLLAFYFSLRENLFLLSDSSFFEFNFYVFLILLTIYLLIILKEKGLIRLPFGRRVEFAIFIFKKIIFWSIVLSLFFDFSMSFLFYNLAFFCGVILICMHVFLPISTLSQNINRYVYWMDNSSWASHFKAYPDPKKTFGREIPEDFRGGGFAWFLKIFMIMMPFICVLYIVSLFLMGFSLSSSYTEIGDLDYLFAGIFILFVSLVPIIVHEYTKGLRVIKAYMAIVISSLIVVAEGFSLLSSYFDPLLVLYYSIPVILLLNLLPSLFILFTDTVPGRMSPNYLRSCLKENNIDKFYTYKTTFNDAFVTPMLDNFPNEFSVDYISSIDEVKEGYVVVPPVSAKSVSMETQKEAIEGGDFVHDPVLKDLLKEKKIEKIALCKIKTMGSSKFWVHNSEITSFRDLVLGDISPLDRWLGYAWVIKV